jgi:hypothetical protein
MMGGFIGIHYCHNSAGPEPYTLRDLRNAVCDPDEPVRQIGQILFDGFMRKDEEKGLIDAATATSFAKIRRLFTAFS